MAEVVSVTLEANISSQTSGSFAKFDRFVKTLGKSVLSLKTHTDGLTRSVGRLDTAMGRKGGFDAFGKRITSTTKKLSILGKEVDGVTGKVNALSGAFTNFATSAAGSFASTNSNLQGVRRSVTQVAGSYRNATRQMNGMRAAAGRSVNGLRMPRAVTVNAPRTAGGGGNNGVTNSIFGGSSGLVQASISGALIGQSLSQAGNMILAGTTSLFTSGMAFEKAMANLTSRLETSQKDLTPIFAAAAKEQGRLFAKLPSQVAASFEEMLAMGISAKDITTGGAGRAVNAFASAGGLETTTAAQGIGAILSATSKRRADGTVDFSKASQVADTLVGVGADTQANELQMLNAFQYATGALASNKVSYEVGAMLIGAQSDIGRKGSAGGREVGEFIDRLVTRSGKIEELGVKLKYSPEGELDVLKAIEDLKPIIEAKAAVDPLESANLLKDIFGEQGRRGYLGASTGLAKMLAIQKKIAAGEYVGKAEAKALESTQTLQDDLIRIKGAFEGLSYTILSMNRGPLKTMTKFIADLIGKVDVFAKNNPRLFQGFLIGSVVIGGILVGLGAMLSLLALISVAALGLPAIGGLLGIGGTTAAAAAASVVGTAAVPAVAGAAVAGTGAAAAGGSVSALGSMMAGLGRVIPWLMTAGRGVLAFFSGPLGLAITAAALLIYKYWEPIKGFLIGVFQGLWAGISDAFAPVWEALLPIREIIGGLWDMLAPVSVTGERMSTLVAIGKAFGYVLAAPVFLITWIARAVLWVVNGFIWLGKAIGSVIGWVWELFESMAWVLDSMLGFSLFVPTVNALGTVFGALLNPLGAIGDMLNYILDFGPKLMDALSPMFRGFDAVSSAWKMITGQKTDGMSEQGLTSTFSSLDAAEAQSQKFKDIFFPDGNVNNEELNAQIAAGEIDNGELNEIGKIYRTFKEDKGFENPQFEEYMKQASTAPGGNFMNQEATHNKPVVNITINGNADAEQVAKRVSDTLSEVEREQARQNRETFYDDNITQ